jgi:hypothetical protein
VLQLVLLAAAVAAQHVAAGLDENAGLDLLPDLRERVVPPALVKRLTVVLLERPLH